MRVRVRVVRVRAYVEACRILPPAKPLYLQARNWVTVRIRIVVSRVRAEIYTSRYGVMEVMGNYYACLSRV